MRANPITKEGDNSKMRRSKPNTTRRAARHFDAVAKAARETIVTVAQKARGIETLLANEPVVYTAPRKKTSVAYALQALLVELGNESGVGFDTPGVAGHFYEVAALELSGSTNRHAQQTLRHLDVLLSSPTRKTAAALIKYWDDPRRMDLRVDPFPAQPAKKAR